eukprot:5307170-Heterocapsa_arctica.AAC.1
MARQGYGSWSSRYSARAGQTKVGGKMASGKMNIVPHDTNSTVNGMNGLLKDKRGKMTQTMTQDMQIRDEQVQYTADTKKANCSHW